MSLGEMLPAVRSLPDRDKLRLIHILAEDLSHSSEKESALRAINGDMPIWTPFGASDAAEMLLETLRVDAKTTSRA